MALKRNVEVTCPNCFIKSNIKLLNSINVTIDERIKEKVLDNDFFKFKCPICGHVSTFEYDCLYHDMNKREMIYLITNYSRDNDELAKELEALSDEILPQFGNDYKLRIVTSNYDLIEKIKILDCNLDDRVMEIYKLYYITNLVDTNLDFCTKKIYFDYDIIKDSMIFILIDEKGETPLYNIDMKIYNFIRDKYLNNIEKKVYKGFQVIDEQWAIGINEYNN